MGQSGSFSLPHFGRAELPLRPIISAETQIFVERDSQLRDSLHPQDVCVEFRFRFSAFPLSAFVQRLVTSSPTVAMSAEAWRDLDFLAGGGDGDE